MNAKGKTYLVIRCIVCLWWAGLFDKSPLPIPTKDRRKKITLVADMSAKSLATTPPHPAPWV